MGTSRPRVTRVLQAFGLIAFLLAGLSIADMYLPRPYDGVVLEADAPAELRVRQVVKDSGAHRAGIRPGDRILGIGRTMLRSTTHAAVLLNRYSVGASVPYLVKDREGLREVEVELGRRRAGGGPYLYACLLGFAFFFVGLFVLSRQPALRPAQLFFVLSILFLLFLVCRLRPASYTWVDSFVLTTGMVALLFLPACFLHFFLVFPRPVAARPEPGEPGFRRRRRAWLTLLTTVYLLPPLVLAGTLMRARLRGVELPLISGAPAANWWVLAIYMVLGLVALTLNTRRLADPRLRRGAALVLFGSVFGLLPFLTTAVAFPSFLHTEKFLYYGLAPLALVPLTFTYGIVRFQLLDIRVILRKSLLYPATTAVVTALSALGITLFNVVAKGSPLAASPYFPLLFALVIVLLFEPVRHRLQVIVDRSFFAERRRLEEAMRELGRALTAQVDLQQVVRDLVDRLPQVMGLHFAALYLIRGDRLERVAGPDRLPAKLPLPGAAAELPSRRRLRELAVLRDSPGVSAELAGGIDALQAAGVELAGELASPRRRIGIVLLSGKRGQMELDRSELDLLDSLLDQAAIALETSLLLEERTQQAELERELQIAAAVQSELLPAALDLGPGWRVAAVCRPARHVGGDFYTQLPGTRSGSRALVYGDVAGKSVSGALLMMAAHEALHSLALSHSEPGRLMALANRRLYGLGQRKSFVALAYLATTEEGDGLDYVLAGQPQPLVRRRDGEVAELPLPDHRLPLGALLNGDYRVQRVAMAPGDLVLGYSDGVVEARAPGGEPFGVERLAAVVAGAPAAPDAVIARVLAELRAFTTGGEPYDDITLVAVARDREAR